MPQYLAPGVYVEEIERGPVPIEGVSTNTAAFLGQTERGTFMPALLTSYNDYLRQFGSVFDPAQFMPHAVNAFFENGGTRCYLARIPNAGATAAFHDFGGYHVEAIGPGDWGKRVFVKISDSTTKKAGQPAQGVQAAQPGAPVGIHLQIAYWAADPAPPNPLPDPFVVGQKLAVPPTQTEDFDDVVLDDASSPNYFLKRVANNSGLVVFSSLGNNQPIQKITSTLDQGGAAGNPPTVVQYRGENLDPTKRMGLAALRLDQYRDTALVYAPNVTPDVAKEVISHCEGERFRFAVIDCDSGQGDYTKLDPRTTLQDTTYAAFYYPWITVSDPRTGAPIKVPPGGAVLGIYARSDDNRGVFKAPANEPVRGALDLEYNVDQAAQETLNPLGVNATRQFPGRGILLWGARTMSSNGLWKYISVRRLLIFLEHSIYDGTQWVVFEPNDEKLWARVKDTIRPFLRTQWRAGALMGLTEAEAFRIACDRSTMTQDDILNGRLICEIGVAPVRPAEFVVFRIYQMTQEAQT